MNREEFKLRMKSLKSYRELNPGKGYWDWKDKMSKYKGIDIDNDDTYDYNGFYNKYTDQANAMLNEDPNAHFTDEFKTPKHPTFSNESIYSNSTTPGGRWDYINGRDVYQFSDYTFKHSDETLDYLDKYDPGVVATYAGGAVLPEVKVTGKKKVEAFQPGGVTGGDDRTDHPVDKPIIPLGKIKRQYNVEDLDGEPERDLTQEERWKRQISDRRKDDWNNLISGLNKTIAVPLSLANLIAGGGWAATRLLSGNKPTAIGRALSKYVLPTNTADSYSDAVQFAADPTLENGADFVYGFTLGKFKDFSKRSRLAAELVNQAFNVSDLKSVVESHALGGETGNDDNERVRREINQMLGRTYYGVPLELGLKPVINIEDAANFTPIGDAMAVKDTYDAVKNNDWITAGLAAVGVLPFVPSGLLRVSKVKRATPEVHKNTLDLINAKVAKMDKAAEDRARFANEQYRIVERVMEDPSYINRAAEVKLKFGDDYSVPYADMFFAYNVDPSSLPQVTLIDDLTRAGTMAKTPNGFVYGRNPNYNIPNVGEHELSHFTDLLKSGRDNAEAGNNMFYQMSKDLTKKVDSHDNYFLNPSEQKAHMNQLREWMFLNGYINTRDLKVTPEYMSKILKQLDNVEDMKGVKRASLQFKSNRTYTKWFNQIPLIGTAALGANAYFTDNNKE